jgi:hypothetical protein
MTGKSERASIWWLALSDSNEGKSGEWGGLLRKTFSLSSARLPGCTISMNKNAIGWTPLQIVAFMEPPINYQKTLERRRSPTFEPRAFCCWDRHYRKMMSDAFVSFEANRYSVPWKHIGREVEIQDEKWSLTILLQWPSDHLTPQTVGASSDRKHKKTLRRNSHIYEQTGSPTYPSLYGEFNT